MMEAKITCTTGQIQIPDLGLDLVAGQVAYVAESKARSSGDLKRAWRAKGVSVVYVERSRVRRLAVPRNQGAPAPTGVPAFTPAVQGEKVIFDPDAIAERVVVALGGPTLDQRISREVGRQVHAMEGRITLALVEAVERTVGRPGPSVKQEAQVGRVADDAPVFIPSRINDEGLTSEIEVQSQQGDDTGLSEAAAALRLVRDEAPE